MPTRDDFIYAAGFFDGEGCVSVIRNKNGQRAHLIRVLVVNTNEAVLRWMQQSFGGDVHATRPKSYPEHWKTSYQWRLSNQRAEDFLRKLFPYLKLKCKQAKLAISLRKLKKYERHVDGGGKVLTTSSIAKCEKLHIKMKLLNRKGRALGR